MLYDPIYHVKKYFFLNNSNIACFSNKKYPVTVQTRKIQIVNAIFLMGKPGWFFFLKIIGVQNQLLSLLVQLLYPDTNELHIKSKPKVIRKKIFLCQLSLSEKGGDTMLKKDYFVICIIYKVNP